MKLKKNLLATTSIVCVLLSHPGKAMLNDQETGAQKGTSMSMTKNEKVSDRSDHRELAKEICKSRISANQDLLKFLRANVRDKSGNLKGTLEECEEKLIEYFENYGYDQSKFKTLQKDIRNAEEKSFCRNAEALDTDISGDILSYFNIIKLLGNQEKNPGFAKCDLYSYLNFRLFEAKSGTGIALRNKDILETPFLQILIDIFFEDFSTFPLFRYINITEQGSQIALAIKPHKEKKLFKELESAKEMMLTLQREQEEWNKIFNSEIPSDIYVDYLKNNNELISIQIDLSNKASTFEIQKLSSRIRHKNFPIIACDVDSAARPEFCPIQEWDNAVSIPTSLTGSYDEMLKKCRLSNVVLTNIELKNKELLQITDILKKKKADVWLLAEALHNEKKIPSPFEEISTRNEDDSMPSLENIRPPSEGSVDSLHEPYSSDPESNDALPLSSADNQVTFDEESSVELNAFAEVSMYQLGVIKEEIKPTQKISGQSPNEEEYKFLSTIQHHSHLKYEVAKKDFKQYLKDKSREVAENNADQVLILEGKITEKGTGGVIELHTLQGQEKKISVETYHVPHGKVSEKSWPSWRCAFLNVLTKANLIKNKEGSKQKS